MECRSAALCAYFPSMMSDQTHFSLLFPTKAKKTYYIMTTGTALKRAFNDFWFLSDESMEDYGGSSPINHHTIAI
jgi:hypothetical protein